VPPLLAVFSLLRRAARHRRRVVHGQTTSMLRGMKNNGISSMASWREKWRQRGERAARKGGMA